VGLPGAAHRPHAPDGQPQEEILNACGRLGEKDLQRKLLNLLKHNPFPHDEIELEPDEE